MTLPKIKPTKQTTKITKFITNTFENAGKKKAIVAVSGGIDSTTSLLLATKALGPENILPIHLPSKTTNPDSTKDTLSAIKTAKIPEENITTIHIGSIIQKTWRIIGKYSGHESHLEKGEENRKEENAKIAKMGQIRLANIAARSRMTLIYDHAKRNDALVVGTENYSEHLLGYYTRFGDEASDLEPIRHLYKTQVIDLATHLNTPKSILKKPPSADLWPGQTDEKELGFSYEDADLILYMHKEKGYSIEELQKKFTKDLVNKIFDQVKRSDFKHHVPHTIK